MKKVLFLILASFLALAACSDDDKTSHKKDKQTSKSEKKDKNKASKKEKSKHDTRGSNEKIAEKKSR